MGKKIIIIELIGLAVAIVAGVIGYFAWVGTDDFKNVVARNKEGNVRTISDREEFVAFIFDHEDGKRVDLNMTFDRNLGDFELDGITESDGQDRPPFIRFQTDRCPNSLGRSTDVRFFLLGDIGKDQFGWKDAGESVLLQGIFEVSDMRKDKRNGQPYCFVDLKDKG